MLFALFLTLAGAVVLMGLIVLMARLFKSHRRGLALALGTLWIAAWFTHGVTEWQEYTHSQQDHKQEVSYSEFASTFYRASFENVQSEYLQLFTFVTLTSALIYMGSVESKDSEERMEEDLKRIMAHLDIDPVDENWSMDQQKKS